MKKIILLPLFLIVSLAVSAQNFSADAGSYDISERILELDQQISENAGNQAFIELAERMRLVYSSNRMPAPLFTQIDMISTSGVISSFSAPLADVQVADDFVVPAGKMWTISEVFARGFVNDGTMPQSVQVDFFEDNGGQPGALITSITNGMFVFTGDIMISLPSAITLTEGSYFVSIVSINNTVSHRWNIFDHSTANTTSVPWLSTPDGSFGLPPNTWTIYSDLGLTATGSEFSLSGIEEDIPAEVVPTMGEWGIIALAMIMMIFSVVALKQRKLAL